MTKITSIKNGPYLVEGPLTIVDASGNEKQLAEGQTVRLCRCGHSNTKPFCDDTHKTNGFIAEK